MDTRDRHKCLYSVCESKHNKYRDCVICQNSVQKKTNTVTPAWSRPLIHHVTFVGFCIITSLAKLSLPDRCGHPNSDSYRL